MLKEYQWFGVLQGVGGNIEHVYNNGVSNQVIFRIPTATQVGGLKDNDNGHLTTENALDQFSVFLNDTWSFGRFTVNAGVRWDRYNGWLPEQNQLGGHGRPDLRAGQDVPGAGPVHVERRGAAHRRGLRPAGRWQDRAERQLRSLSGTTRAWRVPSDANPNTGTKSATYLWNDCQRAIAR